MPPQEILGMVEEAAGTRSQSDLAGIIAWLIPSVYEDRKDKAFKTMEKKEKRLQEIDNVGRHDLAKHEYL